MRTLVLIGIGVLLAGVLIGGPGLVQWLQMRLSEWARCRMHDSRSVQQSYDSDLQ